MVYDFTRTRGMPDHPTFPTPIGSAGTDAFQQSFLSRTPADSGQQFFPVFFIKQGEEAGHLQQTFRRK